MKDERNSLTNRSWWSLQDFHKTVREGSEKNKESCGFNFSKNKDK